MDSMPQSERSRLEEENALLKLKTTNAQLVAELESITRPTVSKPPWWKSGTTITSLTAIMAAVVPVTAAAQGWVQKSRELALEESKIRGANVLESQRQASALAMQRERQSEDIRVAYLERLKAPGEHLRTLRFILETTEDDRLRTWAIQEKAMVEEELRQLDGKIQAVRGTDLEARRERGRLDAVRNGRLGGGDVEALETRGLLAAKAKAETPDTK